MNEEFLLVIKKSVEEAVDKKINGKLIGIKQQLDSQDEILKEVRLLVEERRFVMELWSFVKSVGTTIVAVGGAVLLYNRLKL